MPTIRKHRGIYQTGKKVGTLKDGYRYSNKILKNGLKEIVKSKGKIKQKGGNTEYLENSNRNIIKANYPNNTTVFFVGTFHNANMLSDENIDTIVKLLKDGTYNNKVVELWVENNNTLSCSELGRSYLDGPNILSEKMTEAVIRKLPDVRRGNCPRDLLRGWDTRHHLLNFTNNNTGDVYNAQIILYNIPIHVYFTLDNLRTFLIERMPYENVKVDLLLKYNELIKNQNINVLMKDLNTWSPNNQQIFEDIVNILQKQYAIWSDDNLNKMLLNESNKIIFVFQGLHHFNHFHEIFLRKYNINFDFQQNRLTIN